MNDVLHIKTFRIQLDANAGPHNLAIGFQPLYQNNQT